MQIYLYTVKYKLCQVEDGLVTPKNKSVLSLGFKAWSFLHMNIFVYESV